MKQENMPKADFVVSILLMGFGVWVVLHSFQMPRFKELGANPLSVPGIVPGILGTVIFILSLVVFIRSLTRKGYRLGLNRQTLKNFFQDISLQRLRYLYGRKHELLPGNIYLCPGVYNPFSIPRLGGRQRPGKDVAVRSLAGLVGRRDCWGRFSLSVSGRSTVKAESLWGKPCLTGF
jgi:hypothetical protein